MSSSKVGGDQTMQQFHDLLTRVNFSSIEWDCRGRRGFHHFGIIYLHSSDTDYDLPSSEHPKFKKGQDLKIELHYVDDSRNGSVEWQVLQVGSWKVEPPFLHAPELLSLCWEWHNVVKYNLLSHNCQQFVRDVERMTSPHGLRFVCMAQIQVTSGDYAGYFIAPERWGKGFVVPGLSKHQGIGVAVYKAPCGGYYFRANQWLSALNEGNVGFNRKNARKWEKFHVETMFICPDNFTLTCNRDGKRVYVNDDGRLKHNKGSHEGTRFKFTEIDGRSRGLKRSREEDLLP